MAIECMRRMIDVDGFQCIETMTGEKLTVLYEVDVNKMLSERLEKIKDWYYTYKFKILIYRKG